MLFTERMPATRVNQIQHPGPLYPNSMTVTSGTMITTPPSLPFITVHCCLLSGIEHVRVWQGCECGGEEAVLLTISGGGEGGQQMVLEQLENRNLFLRYTKYKKNNILFFPARASGLHVLVHC